ncbi:hypothetical protein EDD15DRAFT_2196374 [Pisolithus albus]|nr:hypothetical protein EDD15DRAFT_2196374 [Pisolithus albus]
MGVLTRPLGWRATRWRATTGRYQIGRESKGGILTLYIVEVMEEVENIRMAVEETPLSHMRLYCSLVLDLVPPLVNAQCNPKSHHSTQVTCIPKVKCAFCLLHLIGEFWNESATDLQSVLSIQQVLKTCTFTGSLTPKSKNHLTDPMTGKIIAYNRMVDTLGELIQIAEHALQS